MIGLSLLLGIGSAAFRCYVKKVPWRYIVYLAILVMALVIYLSFSVTIISTRGKSYGLNGTGGAMGLILGVIIMSFITPKYRKIYADSFFMALPLMYGIGKIGCAYAGCCAGIPYNGIFKVTGIDGKEVFPIQILEVIVFIALFILSVIIDRRGKFDSPIAASAYALVKIVLDFGRDTHVEHLITRNQVMCAVIVFLFIIYEFVQTRVDRKRIL